MRKLGTKNILSVFGDFRPVERRINNQKVSGWDLSEKSGESVEFENTYNDHIGGSISGKSELKADWQGASGLSSQVQTVQGKNLIDNTKWEQGTINVSTGVLMDSPYRVRIKIKVSSNMTYRFSWNVVEWQFRNTAFYNIDNTFSRTSAIDQFTTLETEAYIVLVFSKVGDDILISPADMLNATIQLELGSTATAYEPFVPNSPSPDYPSPVSPMHGKNLLNVNQVGRANGYYNTDGSWVSFSLYDVYYVRVTSGSTYTKSGHCEGINTFWRDSTFLSATNTPAIVSVPSGADKVGFAIKKANLTYADQQFELGSTATSYEPYYCYTAGTTYKLPCPWGGYWEITLPFDMHGIGDYEDQLEVDLWAGKGRVKQNISKKVFDGTETLEGAYQLTNCVNRYYIVPLYGSFDVKCTHATYKFNSWTIDDSNAYVSLSGLRCIHLHFSNSTLGITGSETDAQKTTALRNYLIAQFAAGMPVTTYHVRSTPLITNLTLTHVDSSTAPSLPLSSLNITTQAPDYPSTIVSAGGEIRSRGKNLVNIPNIKVSGKNAWLALLSGDYNIPQGRYYVKARYEQLDTLTSVSLSFRQYGQVSPSLTTISGNQRSGILSGVLNIPEGQSGFRLYCYSNGTSVNLDSSCFFTDFMISLNDTPYVPYRQPSSILLPTSGAAGDEEDTLEYVGDGVWRYTQRTLERVFDGTGTWYYVARYDNTLTAAFYINVTGKGAGRFLCSHLQYIDAIYTIVGDIECTLKDYFSYVVLRINKTRLTGYSDALTDAQKAALLKSFLAAQYAAGTPVTVRYKLANPIVTYLNLGELKSFPRFTHIEQLGDVKATLNFNAKVYA